MNLTSIILIVLIIFSVAGLFFGYIRNIGKSFEATNSEQSTQALQSYDQQRQIAADAEQQRREYMDSVKQRIQDSRQ